MISDAAVQNGEQPEGFWITQGAKENSRLPTTKGKRPKTAAGKRTMKQNIHPKYEEAVIRCACGNEIHTRTTKPDVRLTLCNECHPFFTGKQKFVDTAGRIEKFQKRFNLAEGVSTTEVVKTQKVKSKKQAQSAAIQEEKRKKAARKAPKKAEAGEQGAEAAATDAAPAAEAPAGDTPAAE